MKYFGKIILFVLVFTQCFHSFSMADFFNKGKAKITNILKNSPLISGWETLPEYRFFFRGVLIGTLIGNMLKSPQLPITNERKYAVGSCLILICREIYIIDKIRSAQNAQKTIKNIVNILSKDRNGFQKIVKKFRFIKHNYGRDLINTLSSLIFSKTKLDLLSSEKLPTLIHTEMLHTLINKEIRSFYINYNRNKVIQNFCLKNSKLIDKVYSEILPLITKLNQENIVLPIVAKMVLSMTLLIYSIIKCNSNETLNIIAILLLISKFDYLALMKSNLYLEFFLTMLNFVSLTKNSQPLVEKKEAEDFFSKLDKSMWAEDLKNSENITIENIDRITNVYFLSKIKEAISNEKTEVKEEDCLDFQNFIHASIYTHLFCIPDYRGTKNHQPCKLVCSYGFLNSVYYTFSWMAMEKNNIIYKFEDTEERKPIKYKTLKGEYQIKKLFIQEEMLTLKKDIKTEQDLEDNFDNFKEKIKDKSEEEKRILLEEIKYVILNDYQPKNHSDFKNNLKASTQKSISKKLMPGITWALKGAAWILIFNFPH